MYHGLEIDVLSLGDADCSIVTKWRSGTPHRVLVDGGCGQDADRILDFLRSRGYTLFWAAVCTHKHNDHASGLIKLVQSPHLTFQNGWMHDMRQHFPADSLRKAAASDEALNTALQTTRELADSFARRAIPVHQPYTGLRIANAPDMVVLGPTEDFYRQTLTEFADLLPASAPSTYASFAALGNVLGGQTYGSLASIPSSGSFNAPSLLANPFSGLLAQSSVKSAPVTQPFNNTSVILGVRTDTCKMLLTADAGTEALRAVLREWDGLTYLGVPHHGSDGNLSQADIERFRPEYAFVSAKGDGSHPSRAIVNGLVKVGANVASTHKSGHLHFSSGTVPVRPDYVPAQFLKSDVAPDPRAALLKMLGGLRLPDVER